MMSASLFRDLLGLSGVGAIVYGVATYSSGAAFVVAGAFAIAAAVRWAYVTSNAPKPGSG